MKKVKIDSELLLTVQEKLFNFYMRGDLFDVTWVVCSEGDNKEERVEAHSSICTLSNRLKELLLTHSGDKGKRLIRIPQNLTSSAAELKLLLHLAYTGFFRDSCTLTNYIALCEKFDMPLGLEMCSRALNILFKNAFLQPSIDNSKQNELQDIFISAMETSKSAEIRRTAMEMFRMHPLLFSNPSCLSRVSIDWVLKFLKEKKLWMQNPEGYVYFGRSYVTEVSQLLEVLSVVHGANPIQPVFSYERSMLAPLRMKNLDSPLYAIHNLEPDYSVSTYETGRCSFTNHPPNQWRIYALTGHITKNWDGRKVLAGLDITYENFITGDKDEVQWGHENEEHYTKQTVKVPEDDVITGFIINYGWAIDKLIFTTLRGMHLDALGSSDGGDRAVFGPSDIWRGRAPSNCDDILVALHGISYVDITSKGQFLINEITFHFSCVDKAIVDKHNPNQKKWAYEALRNKKIII